MKQEERNRKIKNTQKIKNNVQFRFDLIYFKTIQIKSNQKDITL
jgi:hypothetical protein